MANRRYNARLTAVTRDEIKELVTRQIQKDSDTVSNYVLVATVDRLLNLENVRTRANVSEFKNLVLGLLDKHNKMDAEIQTAILTLFSVYTDVVLPDRIDKARLLDQIAIESYLYDKTTKQQNDKEGAAIATTHEALLMRLQKEGIINEKQAEECSIYHTLFEDKEQTNYEQLQTETAKR